MEKVYEITDKDKELIKILNELVVEKSAPITKEDINGIIKAMQEEVAIRVNSEVSKILNSLSQTLKEESIKRRPSNAKSSSD